MDVFGIAMTASGEFLRAAAVDAGYELGVLEIDEALTLDALADRSGIGSGRRRLRALLDVLVALGAMVRDGERYARGVPPPRRAVARAGWGLASDVIRRDAALAVADSEVERRMHRHLVEAGAAAARELAPRLAGRSLLDLGAGAGTYSAAFLDAHPDAFATLVDCADVIALAREHLARFGDRARFVVGEVQSLPLRDAHDAVLLANVLHLHRPETCARLCAIAARSVAPGGIVVIKDLRVDDGRAGPIEGLLFALNMALYTDGGDVYETSQLARWLADAGLVDTTAHRLATAPDAIVVVGTRGA